jgi:hypothetical protein
VLDDLDGVVAERDPPEQDVDLAAAELAAHLVDQRLRRCRELAVGTVGGALVARGEGVVPVLGLVEELPDLRRHQRGVAHHRHVPAHVAARVEEAAEQAGRRGPRHHHVGPGCLGLVHLVGEIGLVGIDEDDVDGLDARLVEQLLGAACARRAVARGVGNDRDLGLLERPCGVVVRRRDPLQVGVDGAEGARILGRIDQLVERADDDVGNAGTRQDRRGGERLAGVDRADDELHLVAEGELLREVDGLGGVAGGIARQELDLPAEDSARFVDLLDRELNALVLGDRGRRERPGER